MIKKSKTKRQTVKTRKVVRAVRSTSAQIDQSLKSAKYFIKYSLNVDDRKLMFNIVRRAKAGIDSKKLHSFKGIYTPERKRIHNVIINKFLRKDTKSRNPDIYVFGGVAGSGKSSTLARFVKEKAMTINNDDIKTALSIYDPSPIRQYPLIHASYLHEESSDIEKEMIERALALKKDIILDRTLASYKKNRDLLMRIKCKGYRVTILGTNLPPHIALIRASARFIKKGRYVPLDIIAEKGSQTNASVLKMAKQIFVSKSRVFDTKNKKPKLLYRKG